jgi:hypothetical protein
VAKEVRHSQNVQYPRSRRPSTDRSTPKNSTRRLAPGKAKDLVEEAIARFKQAEDADRKQRERELEDLRFYAGDQWPQSIIDSRKGQQATATTPAIPARPTITINKQREPVKQVLNGIRQADLGIQLAPADDFAEIATPPDATEISLREGLIRRIQRSSEAEDARLWAATRATIAGRGYYAICIRYAGKTFDREIYVERIYNQASVSLDPLHELPDGSDANWGFKGTDLHWDDYCAQYPYRVDKDGRRRKNQIIDCSEDDFRALGDEAPGWFTTDTDAEQKITRIVRVTEYWYVTLETRDLVQLADGSSWWADEKGMPDGIAIIDQRPVIERTINWCKLDGHDLLDETDWEGPDLPIIKVMGEELQPYDKERRAQGMVRPGRGAQEGFNAMVSKQVETVAYAPIPPWQYDPEAVEGFEETWELSSTKPVWGLPSRTYNDQGQELRAPSRTQIDTPIVAIAQSVQLFDMAIKSTMGTGDPELGNVAPSIKSGKALSALIGQSQLGKSDYLDNLKRSIRYEGQIINNLLYPIYSKRPGRIVRIINGQGTEEKITIAQPAMTGAQAPAVPSAQPQYRLTEDANFNVIIKIQPNSEERRTQEAEFLGKIAETVPQAMGIMGDLLFDTIDQPGHKEIAERWRAGGLIPQITQYLQQKAQGQPIPPAVSQQMASMKQQLDHAHQLLMKADEEIKTKQIEQQGKMAITQQQEQYETARNRENNETKIAVAELGAKVDRLTLFLEERARLGIQTHEHIQGDLEHQSAMAQQQDQQQHDAAMSAQEHQQTLEQGQQAAALAPEPAQPQAGA